MLKYRWWGTLYHEGPKPLQTDFVIHHVLESCVTYPWKNCSVNQNDGDLTPEEIVLSTTNACCVGVCLKKAFIKGGGRYHIGFGFLSIVDWLIGAGMANKHECNKQCPRAFNTVFARLPTTTFFRFFQSMRQCPVSTENHGWNRLQAHDHGTKQG